MKKYIGLICVTALTGCATLGNLGYIGEEYRGIKNINKLTNEEILAKADTFAFKLNLKKIKQGTDYATYEYLNYWDGTLATTCRTTIFIDNDSIHAKINPCSYYTDAKRGWTDFQSLANMQRKLALLKEFNYRYIDPQNPKADSILKANKLPKFVNKDDMDKEIEQKNAIYKRYNVN